MNDASTAWPALPYPDWAETCAALHRWTQIVGKYRLAHTPWVNHSWHATLYITPRGLTTGPISDGPLPITLSFDLRAHALIGETPHQREQFALEAMSTADFLERTTALVDRLGGRMDIHGTPNEIPDARPFAEDRAPRPYDREAVERFHTALTHIERVFQQFRTGFLGKVSPVHLFWGSFDVAVTRFSGRGAPPHPGGVPGLPDDVTREAYSHEVSSAGFWPGGGGVDEPMFYSYAYPTPQGFSERSAAPAAARFDSRLGEFLLSYEAVRTSADPEGELMRFLQSTYEAAADLAGWDRAALECATGIPRKPRAVSAG
ncbi:DUF5996 family protein [Sphingomonas sp. HF-S4]|uniref:DUF5996 family protein n=1 Tax=Sphingomonas agrestis TaxID=3080540 RepID=A0ABU3Y6C8_9SPHN|nr:DUF5996 family protein [Sphingomonas sp. HF-S4]MDV3456930.1 DUF5996 family protein [Sphingomonas sp. HF-S4]